MHHKCTSSYTLKCQFKISASGKGISVDWPTVATIVGIAVTVGGFLWGIVTLISQRKGEIEAKKQQEKDSEGEELTQRILLLEEWRHEISVTVHQLRQEIEHVKEIGDIKDTATREQLTRMEQQLNELVTILIKFLGSQDKD